MILDYLTNFIFIGLENVHRTGTMTEVEAEEVIETAGPEIEILIEEKADALLVAVRDILQETAVEIEEEMILEIEEESDLIEIETIE